jgi:hypothetical protein
MVAKRSSKIIFQRRMFFKGSGLDPTDFETKRYPERPDRIYIIYPNPVTNERMKAPNGKPFRRCRILNPKDGIKYRTHKDGGVHLYFPRCSERGKVTDFLEANPDEPLYIAEGEKKAAKACLEGIPCIGISGIWCWLANKEDRPNDEKILHPDFDFIPDLAQRTVIMVYDNCRRESDKQLPLTTINNCAFDSLGAFLHRSIGQAYDDGLLKSAPRDVDFHLADYPFYTFKCNAMQSRQHIVPLFY